MPVPDRTIEANLAQLYPLFRWQARKFVGLAGAEEDDLVQEAATDVWLAMRKRAETDPRNLIDGYELIIDNAMKDWVRTLSRQGWNDDPGYVQPE